MTHPADGHAQRNALSICQPATFRAGFIAIRGVWPSPLATQRSFGHRVVHRLPFPLDAFGAVIFHRPGFPHFAKYIGSLLFLKPVMRPAACSYMARQGFPLNADAQDVENGVQHFSVIVARALTLGVTAFQSLDAHHPDMCMY